MFAEVYINVYKRSLKYISMLLQQTPTALCDTEPESQSSLTPGKRVAYPLPINNDFESPDMCSTKQSSTKIRRNIKTEKKD